MAQSRYCMVGVEPTPHALLQPSSPSSLPPPYHPFGAAVSVMSTGHAITCWQNALPPVGGDGWVGHRPKKSLCTQDRPQISGPFQKFFL